MDEISGTVDLIVNSIKTKENNRRRKNRRRVKTLINQFEKFSFTSDRATGKYKAVLHTYYTAEICRNNITVFCSVCTTT